MSYFYIILFMFVSCSSANQKNVLEGQHLRVHDPHKMQPGMVKFISFDIPKDMQNAKLLCREHEHTYVKGENNKAWSYVADSYFSDLSEFNCYLVQNEHKHPVFSAKLVSYPFKVEKLKVNYKTVKLSKKDQERVIAEQAVLTGVYSKSNPTPYFSQDFIQPLSTLITSPYGVKRIYNNHHNGQHLGTDFRAQVGVPIPATNRGIIALSRDLFYTGKTIIIDHGVGIFSIYGHLSELKAKEGDIVNRGDIVALSGNTGRSSGPHLHWGMKVQNHHVDGFSVIDASREQFK